MAGEWELNVYQMIDSFHLKKLERVMCIKCNFDRLINKIIEICVGRYFFFSIEMWNKCKQILIVVINIKYIHNKRNYLEIIFNQIKLYIIFNIY